MLVIKEVAAGYSLRRAARCKGETRGATPIMLLKFSICGCVIEVLYTNLSE